VKRVQKRFPSIFSPKTGTFSDFLAENRGLRRRFRKHVDICPSNFLTAATKRV
jgi:hypothetical protein